MARDVRLISGVPLCINYNRPDSQTTEITPGQVVVCGGRPYISVSTINLLPVNKYNNGLAIGHAVYECVAAGAISANAAVYWDATNKKVTTTATNNSFFGYVTPNNSATADGDKIEVLHLPFCPPQASE